LWQAPKTDFTDANTYNVLDLNRVEQNIEFLITVLNQYGYSIAFTSKTNWAMTDFPTVSHINRIKQNILTIAEKLSQLPEVELPVADMSDYFDYVKPTIWN
jgi:hypothetical protein